MSDAVKIALIGLICPLVTLLLNRWFSVRDRKADKDKDALDELRKKHNEDIASVNAELTIICYGVLSALKGLAEQGCDGPVHEAIERIEDHLNAEAHK